MTPDQIVNLATQALGPYFPHLPNAEMLIQFLKDIKKFKLKTILKMGWSKETMNMWVLCKYKSLSKF